MDEFASRKRPKSKSKHSSRNPSSSSSSFTLSGLVSLLEPSPTFFPSKSEFLRLLVVVGIAACVAFGCSFVVNLLNQQPRPFCDSDVDYDELFTDDCEPCPRNGECHEGKLDCARGYRKLGILCIEDGDIVAKAQKLTELLEQFVCEANVHSMCGGTGSIWVSEVKIWNDLNETKLMESLGMEDSVYALARQKAVESIGRILETGTNFEGVEELKCPDWLADKYKPYACRIRQWAFEHALILVPLFAVLVGCTALFRRIRRRRQFTARAEELYQQACETLEDAALMSRSGNGQGEPWVVASWLRDHLLSPKERKSSGLWKKVEELVQEDSRMDRYPKLVKGEAKVVWEWQVEGGSLSSSRKKKKPAEAKPKIPSQETTSRTLFDQHYSKLRSPEPS